jgi:predicted Fe-Mo cluster-binding NifX family protein
MMQKIAVVTENGRQISSHFGMAPAYQVYTIDDGKVIAEEQRAKPYHAHHPDHNGGHEQHPLHEDMFAPISDCKVLICGGMGTPAYQKAQAAGLEVVLVGGEMRMAVDAYLLGQLHSDPRRVHQH